MNITKIAVLPVVLLAFLGLGGCATYGPETTITGFQNVTSFENKKVHLSLPIVVEKDMEIKKNPDVTERKMADDVYTNLKKNLIDKNIFSVELNGNAFNAELKVHYVNQYFAAYEYFGARVLHERNPGGRILLIRISLRKDGVVITRIDSINNKSYNSRDPGAPSLSMARQDFPVPLAPFGHGAYSACGFAFGRPRPPCGPANTAGPQWLYASRSSATADYAPSLRSPWRAAREPLIQETVTEIANQIEKILKEGVSVGKSP